MRPDVLAEQLATTIRGLLTPMSARVLALEAIGGRVDDLTKSIGAMSEQVTATRERLAVLETREPIPGPQGPPGPAGEPGKDGAPGLRYLGVHVPGKTYDKGDLVTAGGSAWYCNRTTQTAPGDARRDWQLMVKHGQDLRDPNRRHP